jgi:4a-hydroxytetrahydrobiopterin dehydratase
MPVLSNSELTKALSSLPKWKVEYGALTRTVQFPDFPDAVTFVNRLCPEAEKAGHHPDIDIRYNKVKLMLVTHDQGGITEKDVQMAKKLDEVQH